MTTSPVDLTRRRLVQVGGAATAALYLAPLAGAASAAGGPPAHLTRAAYTGLSGSDFGTDGGVSLRLDGVADLVRATHEADFRGRDDAFALTFLGPRSPVLTGGIHRLTHPALGAFAVFVSPVDAAAGAQRYEVVVDRSVLLAEAAQAAPSPLEQTNAAAATSPAPGASTSAVSTSASAPAKRKAPPKLLQGAFVARRSGVLTADVRVRPHAGVISVRATLLKDGVEVARAARLLRGKAGVRLSLRELRRVTAGVYDLRMTVTDRKGRRHVSVRRVTVR